jgi:hypothetical protein
MEAHTKDLEVRVALVERDNVDIKSELKGQREQSKAHYMELRDGMTNLTNQISRLVDGLEREGIYNVSREELERRAANDRFVTEMRVWMTDTIRKGRNWFLSIAFIAMISLILWYLGIRHPDMIR